MKSSGISVIRLNEILRAIQEADDQFINVEEKTEEELNQLKEKK